MLNTTNSSAEYVFLIRFGWLHFWITVILLGALILCTIVGNAFVVAAVLLEKHLQGVSNYLIVSLAVADLMVATMPMPLSVINEVSEEWWLGNAVCDFWIRSDVLCCTASILHLVGIALDRYWAVTNVEYMRRRTASRICLMICAFWLLSVVISIPARLDFTKFFRGSASWQQDGCEINQEYGYTIFSTVGAFYMPMLFIMAIYARIYQVARSRIRKKKFHSAPSSQGEYGNSHWFQNLRRKRKKKCGIKVYRENTSEKSACASELRSTDWTRVNNGTNTDLKTNSVRIHEIEVKVSGNRVQEKQCQHRMANYGLQERELNSKCKSNEIEPIINKRDLLKFVEKKRLLSEIPTCTTVRISAQTWNGVCHSAPGSLLDLNRYFRSANESSVSQGSSATRSDHSDDGEWSSSCSVNASEDNHVMLRSSGICSFIRSILRRKTTTRKSVPKIKIQYSSSENGLNDDIDNFNNELANAEPGGTSKKPHSRKIGGVPSVQRQLLATDEKCATKAPSPQLSVNIEPESVSCFTLDMERGADIVVKPQDLAQAAALKRERLEIKRERKAAITLAVITGCFMLCWLPFFIVALIAPFCQQRKPSRIVHAITLWLGYSNSLFNPIIYTIFSPEFRGAFRKILSGKYYRRSKN